MKCLEIMDQEGAGGVICSRSAMVYILDSNFSHNSATGDAGVI